MIVLEYKVKGKPNQYQAIDQVIRTTQFVRNKAIRYWMDNSRELKIDKFALNKYSTTLRKEFSFVNDLNSMAVQSAAERGWAAISRFYDNCQKKISGKKGYPKFQKVGIESFYTDSNGYQEPNPKFLRKMETSIKKSQRQIYKKVKGSSGRRKARKVYAKKHLKVSRQRNEHAKRIARNVCTSNDVVAYVGVACAKRIDLSVRNLVKNHCLAKSISDASWYLFRQWIEYFAAKFDKLAIPVPPHYTSQKCSNCGGIVKKSLSTRTHICNCGCELHRDTNAAINILNSAKNREGHSQINATGVGVSTLLGATLVEQILT
ncbi:RNA-guided endonuclease TnpB family protein [Planktothrix sp. FACHB-1365]|uniref:RNA-guided endonuclease InsQ/TnpB family protein n=1 Tax=Planktothrix sp. FACHB-1365 TaxID=2692855 RepID=UPI0016863028|nr:RNA-guided endonuclease TnpB family protein [Planktothrix sp. FACHB-1365]MBD2483617.1 transposase [Planktothrix sp. FACHB-1365]